MAVEMKIKGLMWDPVSRMPIVVLKTQKGEDLLPIFVGLFEANAIAQQLEHSVSPRPMTHDLLGNLIEALRAKVNRVVITDLKDNTFFALIHLERNGEPVAIDARPSDAMALALRVNVPIFVEETVLERSSASGEEGQVDEAERLRRWLENVDPEELGRYEM
ncbi:MAG TPA: bifunctional nuclease family protein [Candidatus Polarisedimenticolaceae bacterium]|nr:bifunctional nuclease family protein [Candidatus Polarisedimenticolaceae bacterium]